MIKDKKFLKKFRYLSSEKYKVMWETNQYGDYSQKHRRKIRNYWDTYNHYGFNKDLLN